MFVHEPQCNKFQTNVFFSRSPRSNVQGASPPAWRAAHCYWPNDQFHFHYSSARSFAKLATRKTRFLSLLLFTKRLKGCINSLLCRVRTVPAFKLRMKKLVFTFTAERRGLYEPARSNSKRTTTFSEYGTDHWSVHREKKISLFTPDDDFFYFLFAGCSASLSDARHHRIRFRS